MRAVTATEEAVKPTAADAAQAAIPFLFPLFFFLRQLSLDQPLNGGLPGSVPRAVETAPAHVTGVAGLAAGRGRLVVVDEGLHA